MKEVIYIIFITSTIMLMNWAISWYITIIMAAVYGFLLYHGESYSRGKVILLSAIGGGLAWLIPALFMVIKNEFRLADKIGDIFSIGIAGVLITTALLGMVCAASGSWAGAELTIFTKRKIDATTS